jgi:hypothetical protein
MRAIDRGMRRLAVVALIALAVAPAAVARQPTLNGSWQRLPTAPPAAAIPYERVGVWTGKQLIVFGRAGTPGGMRNVAFSYDPGTRRWRTLSPPRGQSGSYEGSTSAVWTGKLVLVWGPFIRLSYDPAANRWRQFPRSPLGDGSAGLVVWTGHELIGWGGGCCGDVSKDGAAYNPATRRWRKLPAAPVAGQQRPTGAWTGRELVVLPGRDPDNKKTGGAAYDPVRDAWRTISPPPQERLGSSVVWDGKELLVVGGWGPPDAKGFRRLTPFAYAYDPAADRWRALAPLDQGQYGRALAPVVWTGTKLLLWGGQTRYGGQDVLAPHGLAYDPKANRWAQLPGAPLNGRIGPLGVWTGKALLVWGGDPLRAQSPQPDDWWPLLDGATFTPRA